MILLVPSIVAVVAGVALLFIEEASYRADSTAFRTRIGLGRLGLGLAALGALALVAQLALTVA